MVDGERIDGAWCHVWLRTLSGYHVVDLVVFADGVIRCDGWTDLPGLRKMLASGKVSVRDPDVPEQAAAAPKWRSRQPHPVTPEGFLGEVADEIEHLNGRPTTGQVCWEAIRRYQRKPTEEHRMMLRDAYLAIPPHRRIYALGDMDLQDRPLRILLTDIDSPLDGDGPMVTPQMHREALDYFDRGDQAVERQQVDRVVCHSDGPSGADAPAITLYETVYPQGWPERLDTFVLRNEYPASITVASQQYPSVVHGYWAMSTADLLDHDQIRDAPTAREAREIGGQAVRRPGWPVTRVAVMADLLRAKFTQHPQLGQILMATGDARISYTGISDSPFWTDQGDGRGRNWMGRLLELIRGELKAETATAGTI